MKTKFNYTLISILALILIVFSLSNSNAQEKSKKQLKEEKKLKNQKQTALLVDSKEFIFVANTVMPQNGRTINLTTEYTVEFHPDLIKSDLPFFGRAFSGVGYGGDEGMRFEGKPSDYSMEKTKKAYVIKTNVRGERDSYSMMLSVYFEGSATLSISSNNRSSISYYGDIKEFKKSIKTEN
jgi:hypothetical protein